MKTMRSVRVRGRALKTHYRIAEHLVEMQNQRKINRFQEDAPKITRCTDAN